LVSERSFGRRGGTYLCRALCELVRTSLGDVGEMSLMNGLLACFDVGVDIC